MVLLVTALLLLCCTCVQNQQLQSFPVAMDDYYEVDATETTKRLMTDATNFNWTMKSDLKHLNILQNDEIAYWQPHTCIEQPKIGQDGGSKRLTDYFEDVTEKAGFNHNYRNHRPARPYCLFDFEIPIRNSSENLRLKGEFCVPEQLPGAAAVADYDQDGYPDIFFTVWDTRSKLYRNQGHGIFSDVTLEANVGPSRYASGAVWADFDADGDLDLYVTSVGNTRHYLYINQGGRFTEEAIERNCAGRQPDNRKLAGMTPNVGDYDRDGYPDLFITEWILLSQEKNSSTRLFHNLGAKQPGYFEDVTDYAGVNMDSLKRGDQNAGGTFTFCSSMTDFDEDGWPELVVTTDYGDSQMFWNNKNGTFYECTELCNLDRRIDAMGHAIGDWNGDTHLDWFSTGINQDEDRCVLVGCSFGSGGNVLFENSNEGHHRRWFEDATDIAGVREGWWGWGTTMFDMDNDKYIDFIMTNGYDSTSTTVDDTYAADPMILWHNRGPLYNLSTVDVARQVGINNTEEGRGLVKFDFDGDGDEDIVVSHNVGKPVLFENLGGNRNYWLRVRVLHRCPGLVYQLCDSLHARVQVTTADGWIQTQEIGSGAHFMAQNEIEAHFGLGSQLDSVTVSVYWPSTDTFVNISDVLVNKRLRVILPEPDDSIANTTTPYSKLSLCPKLSIGSISTPKGKGVQAWINNGGESVGLLVNNLNLVQKIEFDYTINVEPPSIVQGLNSTGSVTVEVKEVIIKKTAAECTRAFPPDLYRRLDGVSNNNNTNQTSWGAINENLQRDMPSYYGDAIATPASQCTPAMRSRKKCPFPGEYAGEGSTRPSPRLISNKLFSQVGNLPSKRFLSDMFTQWGQFLAHDTDFSSPLPRFEFQTERSDVWIPITVPKGDVHFDPYSRGDQHLPFVRSTYNRVCTGRSYGVPREQINKISSYIDASNVYPPTEDILAPLRTFQDGKMKLQNNGIIPYNTFGLANDNPVGRPQTSLLIAGDTRSNVQPGLIALHSLFVREHNRQCDIYKAKHPTARDQIVFEAARRIVIAEMQAITFREFLPALVGHDITPYRGYNSSINVNIGNAFATAAFRYGHSQVNSQLLRFDKDWKTIPEGHLPLRDAYFAPERVINEGGIDPLLRGFVYQPAQEIDEKMVDDMRNVLFPVGRRDGLDLAAMNIQRGRDHGLPDYNRARQYLKLPAFSNFNDITDDPEIAQILSELYTSVNDMDLWVGGLVEKKMNGSSVGETFDKLLFKTFLRLRDGDRFWYERNLTAEEQAIIHENLTLSKIIQYNTDFKDVPDNIMFSSQHCGSVRNHQCIPRPTLTVPTCPPPTDTATPIGTSNAKPTQPVQPSTAHMQTTNQPTTSATSSTTPTTVSVTVSPCCSQLDTCAVEKANLSKLADDLTKNQTQLKLKVKDLEIDLNHEKSLRQMNVSQLVHLKARCTLIDQNRELLLNVTKEQAANVTALTWHVSILEKNVQSLRTSLNNTGETLKLTQAILNQQVVQCQSNTSLLIAMNTNLSGQVTNLKQMVESMNRTTMNVADELALCKDQLEQPTTQPFTVSTTQPLTTSTTQPTHPLTISTTQPSKISTQPPTTTQVSASSSTTRMTTETATLTPCTTPDPLPLDQLKANITQLEQQLQRETSQSSGLRLQLSNEQAKFSHLQQQVDNLQDNKVQLDKQLQRCQAQVRKKLQPCNSSVKATSVPSIPQSQHDVVIMQRQINNLTIKYDQSVSDNQRLLTEIKELEARMNLSKLTCHQKGDSESSYNWSDLLASTPGKILVAIAGGFFLLFVIFFVVTVRYCMNNWQGGKSPKKYDVQLANLAYDYRNRGYVPDEDSNEYS